MKIIRNYTPSIFAYHNFSKTFKGTPKELPYAFSPVDKYDYLADGAYLDIHDDLFAPQNKNIRKRNLSFLDSIDNFYKKKLIEHYKQKTGFPNLNRVSENIEKEFLNSTSSAERTLNRDVYTVVAQGYDGTCSVGKGLAFPGSDLDKAFVIIKGDGKFTTWMQEEKYVDKFKEALWNKTDQRILSYNHDTSFPNVYTLFQIKYMMDSINNKVNRLTFNKQEMEELRENEYIDLIRASKFNILLANILPTKKYDSKSNEANKENVKNFAYFIESIRDGKIIKKIPEFQNLISEISTSPFYKYSNIAQMKAMKNAVNDGREEKSKMVLRRKLENDFASWDLDKQFLFIKNLIKYSCEDQNLFEEYFKNDRNVKENYKPLLGLLCYGDKKYRINPDFEINKDYIKIYLTENNPTYLYQGFSPEVLWVETIDKDTLENVLLHINKLRKTELFKNINRVQAPICLGYEKPEHFSTINFNTANGRIIIERYL